MNNIELLIELHKDLLKEVQELRKEIAKSNLNEKYGLINMEKSKEMIENPISIKNTGKDEKLKALEKSFNQFINKIPNKTYDKMLSIDKLDFRIKYKFKTSALLRNDKEMTINILLDENERFTFTTVLDLKLQQQANDCNAELNFRWLSFEKLEIKYKLKEEV